MIVQRGFSFRIFKIAGQSAKLLHGGIPTVYHSKFFPYHGHGASSLEKGRGSNSGDRHGQRSDHAIWGRNGKSSGDHGKPALRWILRALGYNERSSSRSEKKLVGALEFDQRIPDDWLGPVCAITLDDKAQHVPFTHRNVLKIVRGRGAELGHVVPA